MLNKCFKFLFRSRDEKIADLQDKVSVLKANLTKEVARTDELSLDLACAGLKLVKALADLDKAAKKHEAYESQINAAEQRLECAVNESELLNSNLKKVLEHKEDELRLQAKAKRQQDKVLDDYQKQIANFRNENKDLIAKNENLYKQIKSMGLCIMEKKDVDGRMFSRIAPVFDDEGYKLMKEGKGRLKVRLVHPDGNKQLAYIEAAD